MNDNLCCDEPIDLNKGLIAYYPFNGNANDESGNGHDGVNNGASPTADRYGNPNSAYSFDGVDDYISVSDPFYQYNKEITISCWIRFDTNSAQPGAGMGQSNSNVSNWNTHVWHLHAHPADKMSFYAVDSNAAQHSSGIIEFQRFKWHHYIGMATQDVTEIYLDGELLSSMTGFMPEINNVSTSEIHIGKDPRYATDRFLEGVMDDIRIYNRTLNCNEIDSLYNEGCILYNHVLNETINLDTTIYARNLIELENVTVNAPYELTLKSAEAKISSSSVINPGAILTVIKDDGCIQD